MISLFFRRSAKCPSWGQEQVDSASTCLATIFSPSWVGFYIVVFKTDLQIVFLNRDSACLLHPNEAGMGIRRKRSISSFFFLVEWEMEWRELISNNQWFLTFENVMQANNPHFRRMQIYQVSHIILGFTHPWSSFMDFQLKILSMNTIGASFVK